MGRHRWILWQGLTAPSLERLVLDESGSGFELNGLIIQDHNGNAYLVRYTVRVNAQWQTNDARIDVENGARQHLALTRTPDGHWFRDGVLLSDLDGCVDVDIEWSPSTNTLPIRRLSLSPGKQANLRAAWIRLPSLELQPLPQTYERLDDGRYVYRSANFRADLEVDADGLVTRYGVNWEAVGTGDGS